MTFQFPKPEFISLPIQGSDNGFSVNHVYCVGRNYKAHIREMGVDVKEPPLFFSKPNWAVVKPGTDIDYPADTKNLNYEVELVIAVGENMSIFGFGVGVDLTRRDLQTKAK
ncbi:MAG: FAA hydrolase family protein, partial [Candidatus Marinimicrobia bacterium]|nr:FAA hydrolase family protein [Candidatus Neomarinimicrobiota bacterium]